MNNYLKGAFIFAAGAITGAVYSWVYFKRKFDTEIEEETDSIRESYRRAMADAMTYSATSEEPEKTEESGIDDVGTVDDPAEFESPEEDEGIEGDDYNTKEYYEGFEATEMRQKNRTPKIIKEEEYGLTRYLETVQLFYYTGDGVLANEDEEIIDNVEATVGNALTKYDFINSDESTIYVRNWNLGCDFEITKVHSRFADIT